MMKFFFVMTRSFFHHDPTTEGAGGMMILCGTRKRVSFIVILPFYAPRPRRGLLISFILIPQASVEHISSRTMKRY